MQNTISQLRGTSQAMSQRMDEVSQHLEVARSDLWKEMGIEVGNAIFGLKEQILVEVNRKDATSEVRIEAKLNKTHHNTATTLQDIKEIVAAL